MPRKYNYIYSQLVEDRTDIIGHIAYVLYKADKIEYISRFKDSHNGNEPNEEDIESFNIISSTPNSLDKYKIIASNILQAFLENSLEEAKEDVENTMNKNHLELIKKVIEPILPSPTWKTYLHGIIQSVIGAFVFMIILCALMFFLKLSDTTYTFTIGGNGNVSMEQIVPSAKIDSTNLDNN